LGSGSLVIKKELSQGCPKVVDWFGGPAYFRFLLLKAYSVGFAIQDVTLRHARLNVSFVFTAPLLGTLSDRIGRQIES
jgi:hypothetical protein